MNRAETIENINRIWDDLAANESELLDINREALARSIIAINRKFKSEKTAERIIKAIHKQKDIEES